MKNLKIQNEKLLKKCSLITSSTILSGMLLISGCGMKKSEAEVVEVSPTATVEVTSEVTSTPELTATPVPTPTPTPNPQELISSNDITNEQMGELLEIVTDYYLEEDKPFIYNYYNGVETKRYIFSKQDLENIVLMQNNYKPINYDSEALFYTYSTLFLCYYGEYCCEFDKEVIYSKFFYPGTKEHELLNIMEQEFKVAKEIDKDKDYYNNAENIDAYFIKWAGLTNGEEVEGYKFKDLTKMGQTTLIWLFEVQGLLVCEQLYLEPEQLPWLDYDKGFNIITNANFQDYLWQLSNEISNKAEREGQKKEYVSDLTRERKKD